MERLLSNDPGADAPATAWAVISDFNETEFETIRELLKGLSSPYQIQIVVDEADPIDRNRLSLWFEDCDWVALT